MGQCTHQAPGHLSCLDLERAQNIQSIWICALAEHWERLSPGKCVKRRAHLGYYPCRAPLSPSSMDLRSTCYLERWQTQCGPSTMSMRPCQQYLFAVSLPPYKTTEKVSLNKWPPSPPCVREEIRHWRDLQTEEAKINREVGNCSGSDRCNRLKPCS